MATTNFTYSFSTRKPPEEVFAILRNPKQWWIGLYDEIIRGKSEKTGDEFHFKAGGGLHDTLQKLTDVVPNKKLIWQVTKSHLSFLSNPEEWKDTKICFDLQLKEGRTEITFTHEGLVPEIECYDSCSSAWTGYLDNLKKALE